jgi:4-deoxy-L-threo-5-hexosulose-uronate ketol-isomerase
MSIHITTRHASHPDDVKHYDTQKLREHFLLESIFQKDQISGVYSTFDRLIVGGIFPSSSSLTLDPIDQLKAGNRHHQYRRYR